MMMNLFSVFDPSSYYGISLNWIIFFLMIFIFPLNFYYIYYNYMKFINKFYMIMMNMMKEVGYPNNKAIVFVVISMFFYLIVLNILSLFPFIFTPTAHPIITMGLGVILWMSFFLMGWIKNFKNSAAHLVPEGSPIILSPLLVLIESISQMIRPFTLSIRLAANMMAGHLIIGLLSMISMISMYGLISSIFIQSMLLILEFGVSVIQGFVFGILLLLYALDYY